MATLINELTNEWKKAMDGSQWKQTLEEDIKALKQMYLRQVIKNC